MRPSTPADIQFAMFDDVTLANKLTVTVACSSPGPLSNSAITLLRTSFLNSPGPGQPLPTPPFIVLPPGHPLPAPPIIPVPDRKSTRLNSSHLGISYPVFCL